MSALFTVCSAKIVRRLVRKRRIKGQPWAPRGAPVKLVVKSPKRPQASRFTCIWTCRFPPVAARQGHGKMSTGFHDGLRVLAPSHSLASLFIAAIAWTTFLFSVAAWAVNIHHFIHKDSLTQLLYEVAAESLYQQHGRLACAGFPARQ